MGKLYHFPGRKTQHNTPGHKQFRRLLDCIDDNFLVEVTEELMKRDTLLDMILKIREKLIGDEKAEGSPGFSKNEMVKFRILTGGKKVKSSITTPEFRSTLQQVSLQSPRRARRERWATSGSLASPQSQAT